jgi:hypothetical protein
MNWFTKSRLVGASDDKKRALVSLWGGCDHVQEDPLLAVCVSYENDSFGREGYCLCQTCLDGVNKQEDEEEHTCRDCHSKFTLASGGILWKWYDFHAPQGDEPYPVCSDCQKKEAHIQRVIRDEANLREELER